jgi:fructoselysine-6-P-deglycase FrlB-like protein
VDPSHVTEEIRTQPECWRRAGDLAGDVAGLLPGAGERVAVVGCGTSWFMSMAYAALRETAGHGETDAFAASEMPAGRRYDRVVAITRSGTTTEVLRLLERCRQQGVPSVALTGVPTERVADVAGAVVDLSFADEQSVVQTRFATSALALLRAHLGEETGALAAEAEQALEVPLDDLAAAEQVTFLGRGWTVGLAQEAALKTREAAQFWAEAYPAMDYRHGPIAIAQPGRLVWSFGPPPAGLAEDVDATGARLVTSPLDPMAHLIVAQRLAVALAEDRALDPDRPRHLTRAVELAPDR